MYCTAPVRPREAVCARGARRAGARRVRICFVFGSIYVGYTRVECIKHSRQPSDSPSIHPSIHPSIPPSLPPSLSPSPSLRPCVPSSLPLYPISFLSPSSPLPPLSPLLSLPLSILAYPPPLLLPFPASPPHPQTPFAPPSLVRSLPSPSARDDNDPCQKLPTLEADMTTDIFFLVNCPSLSSPCSAQISPCKRCLSLDGSSECLYCAGRSRADSGGIYTRVDMPTPWSMLPVVAVSTCDGPECELQCYV